MEKQRINVHITFEHNFCAHTDILPGCVATSDKLESLKEDFAAAVEMHLAGMLEDADEIPAELQSEYEFVYELNVRALLKHLDGILTRTAIAHFTGIAPKQLGHYISGVRNPRPQQREKILTAVHEIGKKLLAV